MNAIPKHVASRTLPTASWHATVIDGEGAPFVADLKGRYDLHLVKYGNGPRDATLMGHGLIDEIHVLADSGGGRQGPCASPKPGRFAVASCSSCTSRRPNDVWARHGRRPSARSDPSHARPSRRMTRERRAARPTHRSCGRPAPPAYPSLVSPACRRARARSVAPATRMDAW